MLIASHYLPAACSFVQFVRHRESLLNWKDRFSQTKECQPWQSCAHLVLCNVKLALVPHSSSSVMRMHAHYMNKARGIPIGFCHSSLLTQGSCCCALRCRGERTNSILQFYLLQPLLNMFQINNKSIVLRASFMINMPLSCHLLLSLNKIKFHHNLNFYLHNECC